MKPNQLLAFVAVVEQMSIRGAARTLGISQPAVTKIVRELEREVGAPLVERSVKGVRLTPYGEAFAPRARLLLSDMRRARDEISAGGNRHRCGTPDGGEGRRRLKKVTKTSQPGAG